jgi:hypothetical protein
VENLLKWFKQTSAVAVPTAGTIIWGETVEIMNTLMSNVIHPMDDQQV